MRFSEMLEDLLKSSGYAPPIFIPRLINVGYKYYLSILGIGCGVLGVVKSSEKLEKKLLMKGINLHNFVN